MGDAAMRRLANKKAGERSTTTAINMLTALILVLFAIVIYVMLFSQIGAGTDAAKMKGFCVGLMKTRHSLNQVRILPEWTGDPWMGPAITGTSFFYVSPACGYMSTTPCDTIANCQGNISMSLKYCRQMQESEPETSRPCLTDLEINATDLPPGGTALSKDSVCGIGATCGTTGVPNDIIGYKDSPQKGDSLFIKYDKSTIEVKCQGKCK